MKRMRVILVVVSTISVDMIDEGFIVSAAEDDLPGLVTFDSALSRLRPAAVDEEEPLVLLHVILRGVEHGGRERCI